MVPLHVAVVLVAFQLIAPLSTLAMTESSEVNMPKQCEKMDYCTHKGTDYPDTNILDLNKNNQLPRMVLDTKGTNDVGTRSSTPLSITGRMCPSKAVNETVYYIVDRFNKTRVVVQLPGVLEQVFQFQPCKQPGIIKSKPVQITQNNFKALKPYCKNIYYKFEFYVLSDNKKGIEKAVIRDGIPVYCACKYNKSNFTEKGNFKNWNH